MYFYNGIEFFNFKKMLESIIWDFISIIVCILIYFMVVYIFYKKDLENNLKILGIDFKLKRI